MKITMLGTSGSGKTVYMSAMSELFFNGSVNGYSISNREDNYEGSAFAFKSFSEINTLFQDGSFPAGTSSSIFMPLVLKRNGNKLLDIDWVDYRGGAIRELARGNNDSGNAEILATLLASDVVLVFVDAEVLKVYNNNITARARVGANEISQILSLVVKKKHIDIIFLLSKADSSLINIRTDFPSFKTRIGEIYGRFFSETNTSIADYNVIPIGAVGYGNVKTTYEWKIKDTGGQTAVFCNSVSNFGNMYTVNIASSFATALLLCLNSETSALNTQARVLSEELNELKENFGVVKNIIDILFCNSRKRGHIFDLEQSILDSRAEIMSLSPHRPFLDQIAKGNS